MNHPINLGSDEFERLVMEECVKRQRLDHRVSILLLPSAPLDLALQLAALGAQVDIADQESQRKACEGRILAAGQRDNIRFLTASLDALPDQSGEQPYDIIVLRSGLCQQPYASAKDTVRQLLRKLRIGGKLYLSILGLHSELGEGYSDSAALIQERFAPLSAEMTEKYGLSGPICLYTERNLFMLLLESGASVLRTLTTTYGNVKGVAMRV